jgi:hypothetical protein
MMVSICFNLIYCPLEQWLGVRSITSTGKLISQTQVYNPKRPVSVYFDVCTVIAKNTVYQPQAIGNIHRKTWPGRELICQMISIYAGETTLGHVLT